MSNFRIIQIQSRLPGRMTLLAASLLLTAVGFAGSRYTLDVWNQESMGRVAQDKQLSQIQAQQQTAEAQKQSEAQIRIAEAEAARKAAEAYNQAGLRQATCGDTLSQFVFQPGVPVEGQLDNWGFDWMTARYNTDRWYPLFDSNGLLFAAIRAGEIVQSDEVLMDQAAICNLNQLMF